MDKIICDICGTTYPSSEECCPICGCTNAAAAELLNGDAAVEAVPEEGKKKAIFDFDEVNPDDESEDEEALEDIDVAFVLDDADVADLVDADEEYADDEGEDDEDDEDEEDDDEDDDDDEEEDEGRRHNTFVVILLTVIIVALLGAAGFIFVRYFLPNMGEETVPTVVQEVETTAATTAPTIPCQQMAMTNAGIAELSAEGQQFLLHVKALPENTTDKIVYTSADESIATVTEDGKITAVSEGETVIHITCGKTSMKCPVIVKFVEETVPATTEAVVEETEAQETEAAVEETEAVEETKAAEQGNEGLKNVKLKLKKTDIQLGVYYSYRLELDCDLDPKEVTWTSEHPHIATVDETGSVKALKSGTTSVTAKYGDQEVKCMVRCIWY